MIVPPNIYRQGVIGGFVIEPGAIQLPAGFNLSADYLGQLVTTWVSISGSVTGWSPKLGQAVEFLIDDNFSGMPLLVGAAFNYRGLWVAATHYAIGDVFVWYDGAGALGTWLVTTAFTSGSSFATSGDFREMALRGHWVTGTVYTAGDLVLAPDGFGVTQTWVALSNFTSGGGSFVPGTQWAGCVASQTVFYVVAVSTGMIQIATAPGGTPLSFMSGGFAAAPDTTPQITAYFGAATFGSGGGLTPAVSIGALYAQGTPWIPLSPPICPAAPANQLSYLGYNSITGLYWTVNPLGNTAGDAVLGWVETNATDIIAASNQNIPVAAASASTDQFTQDNFIGAGGSIPISSTPTGIAVPTGLDEMTAVAGVLTPDVAKGWTHQATLAAAVTLARPINFRAGDTLIVQLIQDGTGGWGITFDAFYKGMAEFRADTRPNTYLSLPFQVQSDGLSALMLMGWLNGHSTA